MLAIRRLQERAAQNLGRVLGVLGVLPTVVLLEILHFHKRSVPGVKHNPDPWNLAPIDEPQSVVVDSVSGVYTNVPGVEGYDFARRDPLFVQV